MNSRGRPPSVEIVPRGEPLTQMGGGGGLDSYILDQKQQTTGGHMHSSLNKQTTFQK